MPVTKHGDGLEKMRRGLTLIQGGSVRATLLKNLAAEARTQVMNSFREQRSPYGVAWQPTGRGGRILQKTGRLRNSLRPDSDSSRFGIVTPVVYANIHNTGGTIKPKSGEYLWFKGTPIKGKGGGFVKTKSVTIPRRQFMPQGNVGPIWNTALTKVAVRLMRETFR